MAAMAVTCASSIILGSVSSPSSVRSAAAARGIPRSNSGCKNLRVGSCSALKFSSTRKKLLSAVRDVTPFQRNVNSSSLVKASSDDGEGKTQTEVDNEKFVDKAVDSPEGTAAATVALRSEEVSAVEKVVDIVKQKQQEQETVGDSVTIGDKSYISEELAAIYANCKKWNWRGHSINYVSQGSGPAVFLVHGFGASIGHWRKNIGVLARTNTVYAIDLLGFGASDKPMGFRYTMETWAELLTDFVKEVVGSPVVLIGNSIGSLACLITSAEAPDGLVRGTVLINCAGGMNNKAVTDDWRLKLLLPILWLIDFILSIPALAARLFERIKSSDNIRNVLQSVYNNKDAVDDELVQVIRTPASDPGALNAFITINSGPPGPKPQTLLPKITHPVLVIWGDDDPFTPLDGPVGRWITEYASSAPNVQLNVLPNVGHCPHDDRPELVHEKLLPWLASLFA